MDTIVVFDPAPGPSGAFTVTNLAVQNDTAATTVKNFTLDLSAYGSGDILLVAAGPAQVTTAMTLDSSAMTELQQTTGVNGARLCLRSITLSGAGSATADLEVTLNNADECIIRCAVIQSGEIINTGSDLSGDLGTLSRNLTATKTDNMIWAVAMGDGNLTNFAWTNVTEIDDAGLGGYRHSYAEDADVGTSAVTVETTPSGVAGDDLAFVIAMLQTSA